MAAVLVVFASVTARLATQPAPAEPRLLALDTRWTAVFDQAPSAGAGYDEQTAYVPLRSRELAAIDLDSGLERWRTALDTTFTPATGDGLVFAAGAGAIVAFEQRTGQVAWTLPLPDALAAAPFWDSGTLLISTTGGDLLAIQAQDGRLAWRQPLGGTLAVSPSPAGDRVYVALTNGPLMALTLDSGAVVWSHPLNEEVTGLLALDDQILVGTRANRLHSLTLDGPRVRWVQRAGADVAGAPLADERLIYFVSFDNILRALDRRSGNLRWLRKLPARPAGGPLDAGDVVLVPFVTTEIGAFRATTGADAFTIRASGELRAIPFLRQSARPTAPLLIAMSREGALQGFAPRIEPPPVALPDLPGAKITG